MINTLSQKIVFLLTKHSSHNPASEQLEVYIYGLECLLNSACTVIILFFWGILTHSLICPFIWLCTFSMFRHHTGGLHAPSQWSCILISSMLGCSSTIFLSHITLNSLTVCLIAVVICLLFAPIDSGKITFTKTLRLKEKVYSIGIVLVAYLLNFYFDNIIGQAILYGVFTATVTILLQVILTKSLTFSTKSTSAPDQDT